MSSITQDAQADAGPSTRKPRRPRPNTYTAKACERCRLRKQRCLSQSEQEDTCKNCLDSGSECVFIPRPDKVKRGRFERDESDLSFDPEPDETEESADETPLQPTQSTSHYIRPSNLTPLRPTADMLLNPNTTAAGATIDWSGWNPLQQAQSSGFTPPPPVTYDWNAIMSTFAMQASKAAIIDTGSQPRQAPRPAQMIPPPPPVQTAPATAHAPDEHPSVFETAKGLAMISLEAAAEPHYIGHDSGALWTTVISKGMSTPRNKRSPRDHTQKPSRSPSPSRLTALREQLARPISDDLAALVLETVYRHVHSRYPFMDWLAFEVQWRARGDILAAVATDRIKDKETGVAAYFILMILAIGAQYCKTQTHARLLGAYDYYLLAQQYLSWIVQLHNLANVQGLLLLAIYSLRDTRGPSVWYMSGVTIRLCIGLGLHRSGSRHNVTPYITEIKKRIFWTCYTLDRMVSLLLGRPPGISDDDIDAELPTVEVKPGGTRPLASAVHYIKLKQLESRIQRAVFAIGRRKTMTIADVYPYLQAIDEWESEIPMESTLDQHWTIPCCSKDWFLLRAVETRLHLLRPLCQEEGEMAQTFLSRLAQCAAQGCELQQKTHLRGAPTSSTQLHSTFICGLSLLYAVFLKPSALPLKDIFAAIKAASNTLFVYTNSTRSAGPLFEVFEEMSAACIDRISQMDAPPRAEATKDWQQVSQVATTSLASEATSEYADLFRSLGIELDNEPSTMPDGMWDVSSMFPST